MINETNYDTPYNQKTQITDLRELAERATGHRYTIEVMPYPGDIQVGASALAVAFGVPLAQAVRILRDAPTVVCTYCRKSEATSYIKTLLKAGMKIQVIRAADGAVKVFSPEILPGEPVAKPRETSAITKPAALPPMAGETAEAAIELVELVEEPVLVAEEPRARLLRSPQWIGVAMVAVVAAIGLLATIV
ncbi:MAG: hypothetical protein KC561_11970 [Myxococcales bacterium]|nr:hypothetical protein [Myxococcales bacterium]